MGNNRKDIDNAIRNYIWVCCLEEESIDFNNICYCVEITEEFMRLNILMRKK